MNFEKIGQKRHEIFELMNEKRIKEEEKKDNNFK